jgi:hypothetical protein
LVLSYRIERGTLPKNPNAALCPSQNASAVSAGYSSPVRAQTQGRKRFFSTIYDRFYIRITTVVRSNTS